MVFANAEKVVETVPQTPIVEGSAVNRSFAGVRTPQRHNLQPKGAGTKCAVPETIDDVQEKEAVTAGPQANAAS
jgi:hypothetical protein